MTPSLFQSKPKPTCSTNPFHPIQEVYDPIRLTSWTLVLATICYYFSFFLISFSNFLSLLCVVD